MNQATQVLISGACICAAAVAFIGARLTWRPSQQIVQPRTLQDPAVWLPCHAPACGHMETLHDPTPLGLVCRGCGTTTRTKDGVR